MLLSFLSERLSLETHLLAADIPFEWVLQTFPLGTVTQTLGFPLVEIWQIAQASSRHRLYTIVVR